MPLKIRHQIRRCPKMKDVGLIPTRVLTKLSPLAFDDGKGGIAMATYFMFGKYNPESIRDISIERTQKAIAEIRALGGDIRGMYALLGEYDLLICAELKSNDDALKASVTLTRLTGISFNSCPAVSVETFDRLVVQ